MDMLYQAEGATASHLGWVTTQPTDCTGITATVAPCFYAAKNGYDAADITVGVPSVALSYPTTVAGVSACTSTAPTGTVCAPSFISSPFLQVNIHDRVRVFFAGMLSGSKTMDVGAKAVCGVLLAQAPAPVLVLDPRNETSVTNSGNYTINIMQVRKGVFK